MTSEGTARASTVWDGAGYEALRWGQPWLGPRGIPHGWQEQGPAWGGTDGSGQRRPCTGPTIPAGCAREQQALGQTSGPSTQPSPQDVSNDLEPTLLPTRCR